MAIDNQMQQFFHLLLSEKSKSIQYLRKDRSLFLFYHFPLSPSSVAARIILLLFHGEGIGGKTRIE